MTIRREIVVLLCFVIFASCQEVILPEKCETYFLKSYCAKITQINCTALEGEFKFDGKVVSTETFDITNIIGMGAMVMYTYAPTGIGGVSASWSVGNVTVDHASFWFTEIRTGVSAARLPTQVNRNCEAFCPNECSGTGTCTNGFCECRDEYIGYSCNIFVDDNCFADVTDPRNTVCVEGPGLENCTMLTFTVRVGAETTIPWVVDTRNPLREEKTNQFSYTSENGCKIDLEIFALIVEEDFTIRGLVTAQISCVGPEVYPINSFTVHKQPYCEPDYCSFSTLDSRIFPEPTDITLTKDDDVYYVMEQFSDNPIIDLSFDVQLATGTLEASYNPLCRPTEENAQGVQSFNAPGSEWVIIPKEECSQRILTPTRSQAMYNYFRFLCTSDLCQFSLKVNYHNVDELKVKPEATVVPKYKPIFSKPFYEYYQVMTPRDPFQLKLEVNYNQNSTVLGAIYVLQSDCASKEENDLFTSQRVTSTTPEGRKVDVYTLDIVYDGSSNIISGRYLEITLDFTTVSGQNPIGYYSLVAIYPTDIPSLPSVPDPSTPDVPVTPSTPDVPVTPSTPDVPPESTEDGTSNTSNTSDTSKTSGTQSGDDSSDESSGDEESNNNAGLWIGLTIGALLLVAIVLAVGLAVGFVYYRRSKKSRYPLSIDDDGLLLSDEGGVDFDL